MVSKHPLPYLKVEASKWQCEVHVISFVSKLRNPVIVIQMLIHPFNYKPNDHLQISIHNDISGFFFFNCLKIIRRKIIVTLSFFLRFVVNYLLSTTTIIIILRVFQPCFNRWWFFFFLLESRGQQVSRDFQDSSKYHKWLQ